MYDPMVEAFNQKWLLDDSVVVATPHKPDYSAHSKEKVGGGLYSRSLAPSAEHRTKWSDIELMIECKVHDTQDDPFEDDTTKAGAPEPLSNQRRDVLGQIMGYVRLIFDYQQRTHVFALVLFGRMARITRWDRSGIIVTKKFNYVQEPAKLARFLWRFARMSPVQRGHDITATRVSEDSDAYGLMLKRAKHPYVKDGVVVDEHARHMFAKSLDKNSPWWRLRVDDKDGEHYFLVGVPNFNASGLAGRGTQGFVAINESDPYGPLVYLKDAWRVAHDRTLQEGLILEHLNSNSNGGRVTGVPTLLYHGDVDGQVTETQNAWRRGHPDSASECRLKTHRHYRLVVKEVGKPITEFVNAKSLVMCIGMCIKAHSEAYNRKGYLHRDVSVGNILIYPTQRRNSQGATEEIEQALLTDWELAKSVQDVRHEGPRQPDRTGTWQFMSASALRDTNKRIIVQDDMESFFHVLLYLAIRYLPHNCPNVGDFISKFFDGYEEVAGVYYGGHYKFGAVSDARLRAIPLTDPLRFYIKRPSDSQLVPHSGSTDTHEARDPTSRSLGDDGEEDSDDSERANVHPINGLLAAFLERIRAHYVLHVPGALQTTTTDEETPTATVPDDAPVDPSDEYGMRMLEGDEGGDGATANHAAPSRDPIFEEANRRRLEKLADELADQKAIVKLFAEHLRKTTWPTRTHPERVDDQLYPKYRREHDEREVLDMYRKRARGEDNDQEEHDEGGQVEEERPKKQMRSM
ncbi:hypothetical protein C8Q77DRAFT_285190 [Trametes polyzona]|nr:hypothetical protein C8Q77DRAFT_285190 [Trametes polyzona]